MYKWKLINALIPEQIAEGQCDDLLLVAFRRLDDDKCVQITTEHWYERNLFRYVLTSTKGCLIVQPERWEQ